MTRLSDLPSPFQKQKREENSLTACTLIPENKVEVSSGTDCCNAGSVNWNDERRTV